MVLGQVDGAAGRGAEQVRGDRASWLRRLDGRALPQGGEREEEPAGMLSRDVRARTQAANLRENHAWEQVKTRRLGAVPRRPHPGTSRVSGPARRVAKGPRVLVTRELEGDGFRIENLVFESRPGLVVTANLYHPGPPAAIDARHTHLSQPSSLQDAGRIAGHGHDVGAAGLLGAGHRPPRPRRARQHPFRSEQDYPQPFRVGRQDYYFRYNVGPAASPLSARA